MGVTTITYDLTGDPVPNDDYVNAAILTGTSSDPTLYKCLGATVEPNEPLHSGPGLNRDYYQNSLWWKYTPLNSGYLSFHASNSEIENGSTQGIQLTAYTGTSVSDTTLVLRNTGGSGGNAALSFSVSAGVTYHIAADYFANRLGPDMLVSHNFTPLGTAPPNDDWEDAIDIYSTFFNGAMASNYSATAQAGEPLHPGSTTTNSMWYKYRDDNETKYIEFDLRGRQFWREGSNHIETDFDTSLAVYTIIKNPISGDQYTLIAGNDDSNTTPGEIGYDAEGNNDSHLSRVMFKAEQGVTYYIAVDGANKDNGINNRGNFELGLDGIAQSPYLNNYNDHYADATELTGESGTVLGSTRAANFEAGEPLHHHSNEYQAMVNSIWWKHTPTKTGILRLNTVNYDTDNILAVYTGASITEAILLDVDYERRGQEGRNEILLPVQANKTYHIMVDGYGAQTSKFGYYPDVYLSYQWEPALEPEPDSGGEPLYPMMATGSEGGNTYTVSLQEFLADQEPIVWESFAGTDADYSAGLAGSTLAKTSASAGWNAGAASRDLLTGSGSVSFQLPDPGLMVGLTEANSGISRADSSRDSVGFGFYRDFNNKVHLSTHGWIDTTIDHAPGNIYTIERRRSNIYFWVNDEYLGLAWFVGETQEDYEEHRYGIQYTTDDLFVDVSIYNSGARASHVVGRGFSNLDQVRGIPIVWEEFAGTRPDYSRGSLGSRLVKPYYGSTEGWNAGAVSRDRMVGAGSVTFQLPYRDVMAGLSTSTENRGHQNIDYALHRDGGDNIHITIPDADSLFGRKYFWNVAVHEPGNEYTIERTLFGTINYYVNGELIEGIDDGSSDFGGLVPPISEHLLVDVVIYRGGASISRVVGEGFVNLNESGGVLIPGPFLGTPVEWGDALGAREDYSAGLAGSSLVKNVNGYDGSNDLLAGGQSQDHMTGAGNVTFQLPDPFTKAGLNGSNSINRPGDIDFAFYRDGANNISIYSY